LTTFNIMIAEPVLSIAFIQSLPQMFQADALCTEAVVRRLHEREV
jgi:hypothetical protein